MSSLPSHKRLLGQSLIGILIAVGIFGLLSNAIFTLVTSSYRLTGFTRSRITGRHLAQDKIEFIRNLPYDEIGTVGGIPSGPLEQVEYAKVNGLTFNVRTNIVYVDDSFDLNAPSDLLPTDYKRVRVEVSWEGLSSSNRNPVILVTDITPKGVETTVGGGTLSILVFDANGEPISQADVSIVASEVDPEVNLTLQTQDNGRIILPGAPVCINCYQITVTKPGYSTDRTYSSIEIANPTKPHSTVIEGDLTETSFVVDELSILNITTYGSRANGFPIIPDAPIAIRGDKTIGLDSSNQPVYKYDESLVTNSVGQLELELEWDNYTITTTNSPLYSFSGSYPFNPISLIPDEIIDMKISLSPFGTTTYLGIFSEDGNTPIASVSATLALGSESETIISGGSNDPDSGQSFFGNLITNELYTLTATAAGYLDYSEEISTNGNIIDQIIMTPL